MTYQIVGTPFPVVICELEAGESMTCQAGAMAWMTKNIRMNTNTGGGGLGGIFSRVMTGESLFQNRYTAERGTGSIAFRAEAPGEIIAVEINARKSIISQKGAFIAAETGVNVEIALQKSLGAGFFGGEGFILQRFTGNGMVFLGIDGTAVDYTLDAGETMIMDTGTFAAAENTVSVDVEMVRGLGNMVAGGEGLFNTKATGPGKIWLQTMPLSSFAQAILKMLPKR
ncbi:MAG: TIGR00266 family protein [Treponema sp.]|nr:TIGR00266 family protein [Treponema sp.]